MTRGGHTAVEERLTPAAPVLPNVSEISLTGDAFLLDIDGTLLDIAATPEAVHVPATLKKTLARLEALSGGAVALVSGRLLSGIDHLFAPLSIAAIGCHGAEWRKKPGETIERRAQPLPAELKEALSRTVSDLVGVRIEDKDYTLAFHYRAAPACKSVLETRLAAAIAPSSGELCVLRGKAVFEVKPCAFDKGEAIAALTRFPPFARRRPVFLGDDRTDEYAFAVVRQMGGLGISVGRKMADAERMLPAPHAVRSWLARLAGTPGC